MDGKNVAIALVQGLIGSKTVRKLWNIVKCEKVPQKTKEWSPKCPKLVAEEYQIQAVRWGVRSQQIGRLIVQSQGHYSCEIHQGLNGADSLGMLTVRIHPGVIGSNLACALCRDWLGPFEPTSNDSVRNIYRYCRYCSLTWYSSTPPTFPLIEAVDWFNKNEMRIMNSWNATHLMPKPWTRNPAGNLPLRLNSEF